MDIHWKIMLFWIGAGACLGLFTAFFIIGSSAGGAGAIFLPIGFILGTAISVLHCLLLFVFSKQRHLKQLAPPAVVLSFIAFIVVINTISELTCDISQVISLEKAALYSEQIGYDTKYLDQTGYKMDGCKYGFEYTSNEHFRLFIVDRTGNVKLND